MSMTAFGKPLQNYIKDTSDYFWKLEWLLHSSTRKLLCYVITFETTSLDWLTGFWFGLCPNSIIANQIRPHALVNLSDYTFTATLKHIKGLFKSRATNSLVSLSPGHIEPFTNTAAVIGSSNYQYQVTWSYISNCICSIHVLHVYICQLLEQVGTCMHAVSITMCMWLKSMLVRTVPSVLLLCVNQLVHNTTHREQYFLQIL